MAKRVCITGGLGFIGGHFSTFLVGKGYEVLIVDDCSNSSFKKIGGAYHYPVSTQDLGLFTEQSTLGSQIKQIDAIFHFGEYSRITPSFKEFNRVTSSNIIGTLEVLKLWKYLGCKLVYAGSSTKFCDPSASPYAFTKSQNCDLIKNMGLWFDLDYSISYFYNVYGPGSEGKMSGYQSVVDVFHRQKLAGEPLTVTLPWNTD